MPDKIGVHIFFASSAKPCSFGRELALFAKFFFHIADLKRMAHVGRLLGRNLFKVRAALPRPSAAIVSSSINSSPIIKRHGSGGQGPPAPPIKPPGPEFIDVGWKDDGTGYGDYPNYIEWSYQNRDPNVKYWDQQMRRDFGEPLHVNDDSLSVWMFDDMSNYKYGPYEVLLHLSIALGLLFGVFYYSEYVYDVESKNPALPKTYPYNNLYIEMGGDPDREPTEAELTRRIPTPHYGWY